MQKDNYKAWEIRIDQFPKQGTDVEKLLYFCRFAILSPSGHNSQPWKIAIDSESIRLYLNKEHYLPGGDENMMNIEPFVSLGTFLETMEVAASGYGYVLRTNVLPGNEVIAEISIKDTAADNHDVLRAIKRRHSNRFPYKTERIERSDLSDILSHKLPKVSTVAIEDQDDMEFIATKTKEAVAKIMKIKKYRYELSDWVRQNRSKKYDGMPGFTHGFGMFRSTVAKQGVKLAKNGPQARKSSKLIKKSAALVIISAEENSELAYINLGRAYSNIAIAAEIKGISSSALCAAVIEPTIKIQIKDRFEISGEPKILLRLGKATKSVKHSPRWPLEKLLAS